MDIIQLNDYKMNFRQLGYAIVEQAITDYKKYLEFIKEFKSKEYITNMEVTEDMLWRFKVKNQLVKSRSKDDLIRLFKRNKIYTLKQIKEDMKDINKFIMSSWYESLCPIIDKRIAKDKLEKMEREILGDEIYLLD